MPHLDRTRLDKDDVKAACTGRYGDFYGQFTDLKPVSGKLRGPCPLHGGDDPNFVVDPSDGTWYCHSQCKKGGSMFDFLSRKEGLDFPEALSAVATWSGSPASAPKPASSRVAKSKELGPIVKTYDYTDEVGTLLFQATRHEPKDFRQRRPGPDGTWLSSLGDVRRVLYRLPDVLSAIANGKPVFVCEGEKDAEALAALSLCTTTAPMGAGKWETAYTEALCGAGVVLLPDNDVPGQSHMRLVASALHGTAKRIRIVNLPGLPEKGDVSDWLDNGGTSNALLQLAKNTPDWNPAEDKDEAPSHQAATNDVSKSGAAAPAEDLWPEASPLMFHGLAGDIVRMIDPHTEADPVALLVQLLTAFGNSIGRSAHFTAEADQHFGNLFVVMVGISAKGRKGTSWGHVKRLFAMAAPEWESACVQSGLSSGEGLIWHVRDAQEKLTKNKTTGEIEAEIVDPGISDKRLLIMESEYASVLRVASRDGNTLSAILRDAFDRGKLQTMTKNSAAQATGAHVSLIGHVTADELRRELSSTESANGFANRFLWVCVRRSKELPEGGSLEEQDLYPMIKRLSAAIENGRHSSLMTRDTNARQLWHAVYHDLSEGGPGLTGAVTSRAEAQTMRLALLYALLDGANCIRREHLEAALALWEYVEASARYVFGDSMGDTVADDILRALRNTPDGMSRTDFQTLFGRNQSSGRIGQALTLLLKHGRANVVTRNDTGGRPAERWVAAK